MSQIIQPVRGMNDVLPEEAPYWERLEGAASGVCASYGYAQIRMPLVEKTELFSRSIGEATDIVEKEMYTFADRNGDSLTLRPEATASVVRACLSNSLLHNRQQKLWCSGPMFRHERPQKGRYRQFFQISVEALGYATPETDAELIAMSARLFRELGIENLKLEINSLGTPQSRTAYKAVLVDYFSRHADALDADSKRRLERNPMRILDSKHPQMQQIVAEAPLLTEHLDAESAQHFDRLRSLLDDTGIEYCLNPRLVRGLDYYSRTVFEWLTDALGSQGAVCSGGRYDGLVSQLGGADTPAVGWAIGIERAVELMKLAGGEPSPPGGIYIVCAGDAARRRGFECAEKLRTADPGLRVELELATVSFKSQLKRADKSGAEYAVIIGEDELAAGTLTVKPLRTAASQESMPLPALIERLLRSGGAGV